MSLEIKELTQQRDLAQYRIQEMLQWTSDNQVSNTQVSEVILFVSGFT